MKISLRLGDTRHLSPADAWTCLTSNLVFPGAGSLMAGRKIGYAQAGLTMAGFGLTTWFGLSFMIWALRHWAELMHPEADPIDTLLAIWQACRWALLGLGLFGLAWIWALVTSWSIVHQARRSPTLAAKPPRIDP